MNIMITGDSWGVPNFEYLDGDPPECHTHFLLHNLGHSVTNVSINGNANFLALKSVQDWFDGKYVGFQKDNFYVPANWYAEGRSAELFEKQDYLIWFHTSPFRDFISAGLTDYLTRKDYYDIMNTMLRDISKKVKIIAVGGCGKLSQDIDFSLLEYYIEDWKAEIMGHDFLPEAHLWGAQIATRATQVELIDPSWGDTETLIAEAESYKDIPSPLNIKWNDMFPDCCHPGRIPHRDLVNRLCVEVFDK